MDHDQLGWDGQQQHAPELDDRVELRLQQRRELQLVHVRRGLCIRKRDRYLGERRLLAGASVVGLYRHHEHELPELLDVPFSGSAVSLERHLDDLHDVLGGVWRVRQHRRHAGDAADNPRLVVVQRVVDQHHDG